MEIIVKRIAKKKTYTIGHLYLLKEDEVESRQSFSRHLEDKREFRDTFSETLLDKEHYFCDTLEPTWRNLLGITLSPGEVDARSGRGERQDSAQGSGQDGDTRGHLSAACYPVAQV